MKARKNAVHESPRPSKGCGFLIMAGLVCLVAPAVRAQFIIKAVGFQAVTRPGAVVNGHIKLLNASRQKPQPVRLATAELVKAGDRQWRPLDDPNVRADLSKTQSCRSWMRLNLTQTTVEPIDLVTVPVAIQVPQGCSGLYRAAITIRVPNPCPIGVGVQYEIVVPVLLEVKGDEGAGTLETDAYVVEVRDTSIGVAQDTTCSDPYHTYTGTGKIHPYASLESRRAIGGVAATSLAGGDWRASIEEDTISVTGEHVHIDKLTGGSRDLQVAVATIQVIPVPWAWPFVWWDL